MPYKDKNKQREFQKQWIADRKAEYLKNNGPCVKCGSWDNLKIDHINRKEKITHRVWSWSEERRIIELEKCQILCEQCHKHKTKKENETPIIHGTRNAYYRRGCRCNECTIVKKIKDDYLHEQAKLKKKTLSIGE